MSQPPGSDLQVALLGPFEVRRHDAPVDLGGPQQRAVLAHLVLDAGRVVPVDRLVDRLWGDDPPASALGTLQSYVSRLRRALEPDRPAGAAAQVLVSEAPGYVLRIPRTHVDAFRFDDLAREGQAAARAGDDAHAVECYDAALALWRGPALAGLAGDVSLDPVAVRLEEGRLLVVEDRFDALLALSRHATIVGHLQEAVADHPLRERRWSQLALALYRSGRQAEALRALDMARRTLAEELGLEPGPELRQLEARILRHDPALLATAVGPPRPALLPEPTRDAPDAHAVLVGRTGEWAALSDALEQVERGRPGAATIDGEPGIGKSTLLQALERATRSRGWAVARGRGLDKGLAPALWPWVEVVREVGANRPDGDELLAAHPAVAQLVEGGTTEPAPIVSMAALAAELASLLERVAEVSPLLVAIDDLHWADDASAELLGLVVDRFAGRVLLAVAHRQLDVGRSGPLPAALARIGRLPGAARLTLAGLDPGAVAELIAATVEEPVPADVVAAVTDRTGGNPLFVTELARLGVGALGGPVPEAVRDVVRQRLDRLPERTRALLGLAAVLGEEVDLRVLTRAAGQAADDCLDELDPAVVTRVLAPTAEGRFAFGHALVRDAVLAELSPLRRARLHLRAADAIGALHGGDLDHAEPVARHRWEARAIDDPGRMAWAHVRAGDAARRRGALDAAEELLERAVEAARSMPPGDDRIECEIEAFESLLSVETVRSMMSGDLDTMADRIDDVAERNDSDVARQLALFTRWSAINLGRLREVERHAEAMWALACASEVPYLVLLARYCLGGQAMFAGHTVASAGQFAAAIELWEATRTFGSRTTRRPPVNLPGLAVMVFALRTDSEHHRRAFALSEERAAERGSGAALVDHCLTAGIAAAISGDVDEVRRLADRGLDPARTAPLAHVGTILRVLQGWARCRQAADVTAAAEQCTTAMAELDHGPVRTVVPLARTFHGDALLTAGHPDDAIGALELALAEAEEIGEVWWIPETLRVLAAAREATGAAPAEVAALRRHALERAEAQEQPAFVARIRAELG